MQGFSRTYVHPVTEIGVETIWEEAHVPPFNELIISWNALRPKRGHFRISASVKSQNVWSPWLHYAEWGAEGQKTFASKSAKSIAQTQQDTVVLAEDHFADAFRIKVETLHQATLERFDTLFACASNLQKFDIRPPLYLDPVRLPLESLRSQMALKHPRMKDLCSPTSTCMAIDFLLKKRTADPIDFAAKVHDSSFDIYGNWVLNVAESYQKLAGRYYCRVERLPHFAELHRHLRNNLPVVVSVRGPLPNAPFPFHQGHLLLVYGYDPIDQRVLCADPAHPADSDTPTAYPLSDFLAAWARRKNLSYLFSPK